MLEDKQFRRNYYKPNRGGDMKIGKRTVSVFKIKNRSGFAAICDNHLTEGPTQQQAIARMVKALNRTDRKK